MTYRLQQSAIGMILSALSVCLSGEFCGAPGWCRGLKVVPSCSKERTSYVCRRYYLTVYGEKADGHQKQTLVQNCK